MAIHKRGSACIANHPTVMGYDDDDATMNERTHCISTSTIASDARHDSFANHYFWLGLVGKDLGSRCVHIRG